MVKVAKKHASGGQGPLVPYSHYKHLFGNLSKRLAPGRVAGSSAFYLL